MASAPSEDRSSCFQVIEDGLAYPPVLLELKRHTLNNPSHRPSSSAQSSSNPSIALRFQAVRFLNGKQEVVQISLGGGNDLDSDSVKMDHDALVKAVSGRKGLNKPSLTYEECCDAVYTRFEEGRYTVDYRKDSHTLQVTLDELKEVDISFDFAKDVKKTPAAAAFVIAFEAACQFSRLLKSTRQASEQAAEELRLKDKELRKAEKMANNLSSDLSNERQRMQRLLSSGGSSLEDVLNPRSLTGKAGRRSASSIIDMSMPILDPDSPRKKRKAADAVLTKAGRTAQKETKTGFIDDDDEDEDEDGSGQAKSSKASTSRSRTKPAKASSSKPSSTDTASSAAESKPKGKSGQGSVSETASSRSNASKARKKVAVQPTLNGRRAMKSVKSQPKEGWLDEEEEEDSKTGSETETTARKSAHDTRAKRAADTTSKASEDQGKGKDVAAEGADSDTATDKTD